MSVLRNEAEPAIFDRSGNVKGREEHRQQRSQPATGDDAKVGRTEFSQS